MIWSFDDRRLQISPDVLVFPLKLPAPLMVPEVIQGPGMVTLQLVWIIRHPSLIPLVVRGHEAGSPFTTIVKLKHGPAIRSSAANQFPLLQDAQSKVTLFPVIEAVAVFAPLVRFVGETLRMLRPHPIWVVNPSMDPLTPTQT